jgi:hypothetical protein
MMKSRTRAGLEEHMGEDEKGVWILIGNPEGKSHPEDLGLDGNIKIKFREREFNGVD